MQRKHVWIALGLILTLVVSSGTAQAAGGALDPSFKMGDINSGFAGVQSIPEIRGMIGYTSGNTDGNPWPTNGYNLIFGSFWGISLNGNPAPTTNCIARLDNNGALDNTFNVFNNQPGDNMINGEIRGVFIYPHDYPVESLRDYILIWGRFSASVTSGTTQYQWSNLARLTATGALDTNFPSLNLWGGAVNSVIVQGGGTNGPLAGTTDKILVGGYNLSTELSNSNQNGTTYQLIRLDYAGNPDNTFTHWGAPNGYISKMMIASVSSKNYVLIYCSYPKNDGSGGTYYVLLLDSNAYIPSKLHPPVTSIGSELVDGPINDMVPQSNGTSFVACGQFHNANNGATMVTRNRIARFTTDSTFSTWTLDPTYDVGSPGPGGNVYRVSPLSSADDRMVVTGNFNGWNGTPCGYIMRLTTTGTVDPDFHPGGGADDRISELNWNNDGSGGWICGYFRNYNGQARGGITGLNGDGTININNFSNITAKAGFPGMVYSLARQSDGKIIIGGDFNGVCGKYRGGFARINPNGSLDPSFKGGVDGVVNSVAIQADGKILLGGQFGGYDGYPCTSLARVNANGSPDLTFKPMLVANDNSLNQVNQVLPLSNGQIMIAGDISDHATYGGPVARLNSDGSLDSGFINNVTTIFYPTNPITGATGCSGQRVALAGSNYVVSGHYDTATAWNAGGFLTRFTNTGTLDTSFGPGTPVANFQTMDGEVDDMLLQPDGKIVVSGTFSHVKGSPGDTARSAIARFAADGLLDSSFTPSLSPPTGANTIDIAAIALQTNGKILIEEHFLNSQGNNNYQYSGSQVARLKTDGSTDPNFSLGTWTSNQGYFYPGSGSSILPLSGGKALVGGAFSMYGSANAFSLVRIFAGATNTAALDLLLLTDD